MYPGRKRLVLVMNTAEGMAVGGLYRRVRAPLVDDQATTCCPAPVIGNRVFGVARGRVAGVVGLAAGGRGVLKGGHRGGLPVAWPGGSR